MAHQAGPEEHPSAEELRRRLYGGDATDEDRARYRAVLEATKPRELPETAALPAPAMLPARAAAAVRPRRLLLPISAGIAAVAVAAGIGLAVLTRAPAVPPGRPPSAVAVDGETRSEFVQNLAGGGAAGIAAYLVTHRSPAALRGATRFYTIERNGVGPEAVVLSPVPPETSEGRATVFLVVEWPGTAGWSAYGWRSTDGGPLQPEARRAGHQEGGVPTSATFAYRPGRPPVQLNIDVPAGVRWGAAVVFSD
jgi:hypothetical protein